MVEDFGGQKHTQLLTHSVMLQLLVTGCLFYWLCYWAIVSYSDHATTTSNKPQDRISARKKTNKGCHSREDTWHGKRMYGQFSCSLDDKMVNKEQ